MNGVCRDTQAALPWEFSRSYVLDETSENLLFYLLIYPRTEAAAHGEQYVFSFRPWKHTSIPQTKGSVELCLSVL